MRPFVPTCLFVVAVVSVFVGDIPEGSKPRRVSASTIRQTPVVKIKEVNPVVNEGNRLTLTATDERGQPLSGVTWESGSPGIAEVDPATGVVRGILRGFATITARRGDASVSTFVVVARVEKSRGATVSGDTDTDIGGRIYLSDPRGKIILRKDGLASPAGLFAGQRGEGGKADGQRLSATFESPTAVAVDNGPRGGVYVADTLNHNIREIDFNDQVKTVLNPSATPGRNTRDATPLAEAKLSSPRGVAVDTGGNLFVADTDNHAIFYVDFEKREVRVLAGEPGTSGLADGKGRGARFTRPTGIALSSDGHTLVVADSGNNVVRLVTHDGQVSTLGKRTSAKGASENNLDVADARAEGDAIVFDEPQSVGIDVMGDVYVIDKVGAFVVMRPVGQLPQVVALAQPGVSFGHATSLVVNGARIFVLDDEAKDPDEAVKIITVGAPEIAALSRESVRLEGGEEVVVTGGNFSPEAEVVLGDRHVTDFMVESATSIRFRAPKQDVPGNRTLTIWTRGGTAQRRILVVPKSLGELQDGQITTIAGGIPYSGDGGSAISADAALSAFGVTLDEAENVFVADYFNAAVRRIDAETGIITTVAGNGRLTFAGDGGLALHAGIGPTGVALDGAGDLFIVDWFNNRVRRVDVDTGFITTIAGTGQRGFSGDGGRATDAALNLQFGPGGIALDRAGNVFVSDGANHRVRRIDCKTGLITTVAGNGEARFSGDGGPAGAASLNFPGGLVFDRSDNLLIADQSNRRVRRVDTQTGVITTVAGNGIVASNGDGGLATSAGVSPIALTVDASGRLLIADGTNFRIRRVDSATGIISTVAGNGNGASFGDGGPAAGAGIVPSGLAVDGLGNLFVAEATNRVRRIDGRTGDIVTHAGTGRFKFNGRGGQATGAGLTFVPGVAVDRAGNVFLSDENEHFIHRIDGATGVLTVVAGTGAAAFSGDGGPAATAGLRAPQGIAFDSRGNLFIADRDNNRVRRIDALNGNISTVAGSGIRGFSGDGGPALAAALNAPTGVALDPNDNLFIADRGNNRVRRVDVRTGEITTVAGNGIFGFGGDDGPATGASFRAPNDIAFEREGTLLIADTDNNVIRRVNLTTNRITTTAGNGRPTFTGDGEVATKAGFKPLRIAVDSGGHMFVADAANHRIRRIDWNTNIITTVAGSGRDEYVGDGGSALKAGLSNCRGVALDSGGNLFIADTENKAARVVKNGVNFVPPPPSPPSIDPLEPVRVRAGETVTVKVTARDPDGPEGLTLTLVTAPGYVRLFDEGNGVGTLRIAPAATESQSGTAAVKVTDPTGLSAEGSFIISLEAGDVIRPTVTGVTLSKSKVIRKKDATLGITWTSSDNVGVASHDVLFAPDGVNFSVPVTTGLSGIAQSFTWTVPASVPKTKNGIVKVIARDAGGNTGEAASGSVSVK